MDDLLGEYKHKPIVDLFDDRKLVTAETFVDNLVKEAEWENINSTYDDRAWLYWH